MWNKLWREWTIDRPAALGDWLWDIFVVQFAAFLNKVTRRQVILFIPVILVIVAYDHRIPVPPELMLVGDLFAYIDVVAVAALLGILSRATTIVFIAKEVTARAGRLAGHLLMRRQGVRHRRARSVSRKRLASRRDDDEGEWIAVQGVAWV